MPCRRRQGLDIERWVRARVLFVREPGGVARRTLRGTSSQPLMISRRMATMDVGRSRRRRVIGASAVTVLMSLISVVVEAQVPPVNPPITGLPDPATSNVASSVAPSSGSSSVLSSVSPGTALTTALRAPTTSKPRKIVRRSTTSTTIVVPTIPVISIAPPSPGPDGVNAGSSIDPNNPPPLPVGETTSIATLPATNATNVTVATIPSRSSVPISSSNSTTTTVPPPATPAQLRDAVLSALSTAGGQRSITVMMDGQPLVDSNGAVPHLPASTQKIYVAATALSVFGPDHRFETVVRSTANNGGVVTDLTVVASGDPSFSFGDLRDLAKQVRAAGITSVTGRVMVDDSLFDRSVTAPGWKPEFSPGEVGLLNAFLIDGNHRNDSAMKADAGLGNLARFKTELVKAGVAIAANVPVVRSQGQPAGDVVATIRSAPLSELVTTMLKRSENTYAETLLKQVGTARGQGSTQSGVDAVAGYHDRLGIAAPVAMVDGSGLSGLNRSTAAGQVTFLSKVVGSGKGETFRGSLSVACVDGTLRSRMCGTPAANNVRAKTGSLNGVTTLAGYVTTAGGRPVVFSMLLSGVPSTARARAAIDRALILIASYRN
jgi:serine-type D-Ala-D-Ala carboxypeptidase/endopeptidase (penicillin-binding protein 4)